MIEIGSEAEPIGASNGAHPSGHPEVGADGKVKLPPSPPVPGHLQKTLTNSLDRLIPKVKLEVMGVGSVRVMLGLMWGLGMFNLVLAIIILSAIANSDLPKIGETSELWTAVYTIEGILRTIGVLALLFMLLSFPQRIFLHYWRHSDSKPFWNQILIVAMTLLMSIVPGYSLYELVIFWLDFRERSQDFSVKNQVDSITFSFGVLTLLHPYPTVAIGFNTVASNIVLACTFLFFGGVFHNQYQAARDAEAELHPADDHDKYWVETTASGRDFDFRADDDEELGDNQATREYQAEVILRAKSYLVGLCEGTRVRLQRYKSVYKRWTGRLPLGFQLLFLFYLVTMTTLCLRFKFHPSAVPLVSLITLIRICNSDVTQFLARNEQLYANITDDSSGTAVDVNISVKLIISSTVVNDELGVCSPSQDNPITFQRAFSVVVFFTLEVMLFVYVAKLGDRTRKFLRGTSYAHTRREILGYHFFRHIAIVCWVFIILVGVFSTAINPIEMYIVEFGSLVFNLSSQELVLQTHFDPLFQVGVGIGTIGYGSFFTMMMVWVIMLANVYLPADSVGLRGWFRGKPMQQGEEDMMASLHRDDYLILVPQEQDVQHLLALRHREKEAERQLPRMLRKHKSTTFQMSSMMSGHSVAVLGAPLVAQVRANLLVLETEILLFHFMHLSYILAGKKLDPVTGSKVPLTWAEKETLIEDARFRLVEHVVDADTDTHAMIFASEDRVVVAFRGSVSLTNWQTDFDSSEVLCEYAQAVPPDLSDVPPAMLNRAKKVAARPPLVHGGFVKAYETVRQRITQICDGLLNDQSVTAGVEPEKQDPESFTIPKSQRVLFVTGHSLGGGLAILCAMDLALTLKLPRSRVALTTWGSPKVGTYSFVVRFSRVCPCARRFCMADDIITNLPVAPFLQSVTLHGWWHCGTEILMNELGNMLIRPTPIERFMFQRTIGSPQAHLRMTYATALMIWAVRSHRDYQPDWWIGVVTLFYKNAQKRLRRVPGNIRDRLMDSLLKAGVTYTFNNRTVRDMMVDTADERRRRTLANKEDSGGSRSKRNEEEEQEPDVSGMVTELLIALRLRKEADFNKTLDALIELRARKAIFEQQQQQQPPSKRKQEDAELDDENDDAPLSSFTDAITPEEEAV